jgi:membrane protease YdiL (CAAX protease family)
MQDQTPVTELPDPMPSEGSAPISVAPPTHADQEPEPPASPAAPPTHAGQEPERPVSPGSPPAPLNEEDRRTARSRFSRMGLGVVLLLLVSTVVQLALASVLNAVVPGVVRNTSWGLWVITFAPQYLAGVPVCLLLLRKVPALHVEGEKLSAGKFFAAILISIFMMYAGNLLGALIQSLTESVVGFVPDNPLDEYVGGDSPLLQILFMVILAPLIEEYIFRRSLIDRMRPYGEKLAVVTTALMFGLFHGNLSQMFYAFTLGLVFGYVYLRTGKLRYTVGLHMLINLLGGVVGPALTEWAGPSVEALEEFDPADMSRWSRVSDLSETITPGAMLLSLYTVAMLAAGVAGLVVLIVRARRVYFRPAPLELGRGQRFRTVWLSPGMLAFVVICLAMVVTTFLA